MKASLFAAACIGIAHLHPLGATGVFVDLRETLPANPFYIPKEKAEQILQSTGLSIEELLTQLIPFAQTYARPPISNYKVGIAGLGRSGNIYLGVNLEFSGLPLNYAIHGEQFMIANALNHGETGIVKMATSAAPCGHCRQFLNEIDIDGRLEILIPNCPPEKLSFFLPEAFGPKDLGLMIDPWAAHDDSLKPSSLIAKAIDAAMASHAPYSRSKSGVAIQTSDGKVYTGAYLENAAFNPSLSPLHAALAALVSDLRSYDEIAHAILVEQEGAKISHEIPTRAILDRIAPQTHFHLEIVQ